MYAVDLWMALPEAFKDTAKDVPAYLRACCLSERPGDLLSENLVAVRGDQVVVKGIGSVRPTAIVSAS